MMLAVPQLGAKATPLPLRQSRPARRFVCLAAKSNSSEQEAAAGRRNFLTALGLITAFTAAKGAQAAADPYEELKSITASRTGVTDSLLESYEKTRAAVTSTKSDRGIRERLAAEAANAPTAAPASSGSGLKLGGFGPFSAPAAAPTPAAPSLFASTPAPKAPAPKPAAAAPKPAAAPAAAAGVGPVGGIAEALGVLGLVGVGATAVTNFVTSNSKGKAKKATATPAAPAAAAAAPSSSGGTRKAAAAGTGKVTAGTGKVKTGTGKTKVAAAAPARAAAAASSTAKVVKKVPAKAGAAAAASTGTVKEAIKKALVNEEKPEEPTDFAVAGFLGFAGLLAAFFLFGLPQPVTVTTEGSKTSDPLVEEAKQAITATAPTYTTPLFKSLNGTESEDQRKVIIASKSAPEVAATLPKPSAVAPPAAAPAEASVVPAVLAPTPAKSVEEAKPAPVEAEAAAPAAADQTASSPNNLLIVGGGLALIVAAFAAVGGGNSESSTAATGGAATATTTPPADTADGSSSSGKAESSAAAVAETVTAAASTAAAAAPSAPGAPAADNAAYEKAVNALFADPDTADELYAIIAPALRNGPALAWALVSNATNAETLDGWAFQKLSSTKYKRVRQLLVDMGLDLPETPKPQPTLAAFGDSSAGVPLDPEKLRSVFEALLANPASRTLMRKLLAGAGMPFNEAAFEEQIKDSTYFNLAIAPILRKMPPQKLAVLADLQDPAKLQELVNSVSSLAADNTQLDAVTAELSGDVRNTVEKIREDSRETESSTAGSR